MSMPWSMYRPFECKVQIKSLRKTHCSSATRWNTDVPRSICRHFLQNILSCFLTIAYEYRAKIQTHLDDDKRENHSNRKISNWAPAVKLLIRREKKKYCIFFFKNIWTPRSLLYWLSCQWHVISREHRAHSSNTPIVKCSNMKNFLRWMPTHTHTFEHPANALASHFWFWRRKKMPTKINLLLVVLKNMKQICCQ